MQVKWLGVLLLAMPWCVNANQSETLPDPELLEFLGRYSIEEQTWLELAMEQEQQKINKENGSTASVREK